MTRPTGRRAMTTALSLLVVAAVGAYLGASLPGRHLPGAAPMAAVLLAGVPAVLATRGWGRRVVGALLVAAAVALGWISIDSASRPVGLGIGLVSSTLGIIGGGLVLARVRSPRLGARYDAPGVRSSAGSPDQRMWSQLSSGGDPTDDPGEPDTRH